MCTFDRYAFAATIPGVEKRAPIASQIKICVKPTAPTPRILPASNSFAVTEESSTSRMREFFSSMIERITDIP